MPHGFLRNFDFVYDFVDDINRSDVFGFGFVTKLASSFQSEVFMSRNGRRVNAKSIMGVMMLAAGMGSEVELEAEGDDEQAAMAALLALINDKFGEGQ